jgi:hypothetical protein
VEVLANVMKVQGVAAAAVFAADDSCLEFAASEAIFEPIMILAAIRAAEDNLDVFRTIDKLGDAHSFTCELEHGFFVYRQAGSTRLGVMALTGVNVAMLDIAVGVASLKVAQADARSGFPAMMSPGSASAEYAAPTPQAPAMGSRTTSAFAVPALGSSSQTHGHAPPPMPRMPNGPTATPSHGMVPGSNRFGAGNTRPNAPSPMASASSVRSMPGSSSGVSTRSAVYEDWRPEELLANGSRVPGTIGPSVMQHVLRALARYLGGHAKSVIVEELAHLGATPATARPDVFTDFIHNVAERIPDPSMHDEFVKLALGDRR